MVITRAEPLGIEIVEADLTQGLPDGEFFGVLAQLPGASGRVVDHAAMIAEAHERGALVAVGADLLAMTLLTPPGDRVPMRASAPPSASVSRWASAARMRVTSRSHSKHARRFPDAWSASRWTRTETRHTDWRCDA